MEKLIAAINKLQDVFNTLSIKSGQSIIQLPQIVMVGAQSTGKSSSLESIVRHSFLPRGKGIVTRCPLVLQLIHCPMSDKKYRKENDGTDENEEWGVFSHKPDLFFFFDNIRVEIEEYTDVIAGSNKGISHTPIRLTIYSPKVVNLTLVDLPGLIKVPIGDQPENIEDLTLELIMEYVNNPNSIILAVSSADADLATSESLKIAKKVDPEGKRTLAVITKLDRMESFADGIDILTGNIKLNIPVKLGIIGIFNRSQNEKTGAERSIEEQIEFEKQFLEKNFPGIAHRNGVKYLEKSLSNLLMRHIQECLPNLRKRVAENLKKYEDIMEVCGDEITDKNRTLSRILTNFTKDFENVINGTSVSFDVTPENLIGGPAIRKIFDENFSKKMETIEPLISKQDIINFTKQIGGPRPSVFAPEILFETIVKDQIKRLREPSIKCAESVQKEMEKIIKIRVFAQPETQRFPALMRKIGDVLLKLLAERAPKTRKYIEDIIKTELSCINTNHPDFSIQTVLKEYEQKNATDKNNNNAVAKNQNVVQGNGYSFTDIQSDDGEIENAEEFKSRKSEKDAIVIEKLIREYFALEKKKIEDSIPKSIMFSLVNYMKENAQGELLSKLFKNEENLLAESEEVALQRSEAVSMLKALREADETIDDVSDFVV